MAKTIDEGSNTDRAMLTFGFVCFVLGAAVSKVVTLIQLGGF